MAASPLITTLGDCLEILIGLSVIAAEGGLFAQAADGKAYPIKEYANHLPAGVTKDNQASLDIDFGKVHPLLRKPQHVGTLKIVYPVEGVPVEVAAISGAWDLAKGGGLVETLVVEIDWLEEITDSQGVPTNG